MQNGGIDKAISGGGADNFYFGDTFTAADTVIADKVAGGTLELFGTSYAGGITLAATSMQNVTQLWLDGGASYGFTLDDGNVAKGKLLTVDGTFLASGQQLTFNGGAETDGRFYIYGGEDNDTLTGGAKGDTFDLFSEGNIIFSGGYGGGADTASGGGGNDQFLGVIEGDVIDGGAGFDTATAVTPLSDFQFDFAANTLTSIEKLIVGGLFYVTVDANVAVGKTLVVEGHAGSFDGSAESDGHFKFVQDGSDARFIGGALKDTFDVTGGGGSHLVGNGGNDMIIAGAAFNDHDEFDGGVGVDTVSLDGDYATGFSFVDTTITGIEKLLLGAHFDYTFTLTDGNVAAGGTLTVDGSALRGTDQASLDGSAETDGRFVFLGGAGADTFKGGAGADLFTGGLRHDTLTGGLGADRFIYTAIAESKPNATADLITDFTRADGDRIDLSAIDAISGTPANNAFHFIGTAAFSGTAGELRFEKISGNTIVTVDVNGDAVADFEITLTGKIGLHATDFIL
jgi:Ca2+-binding RTX toxin-like protein